jgi:hypothetical protein
MAVHSRRRRWLRDFHRSGLAPRHEFKITYEFRSGRHRSDLDPDIFEQVGPALQKSIVYVSKTLFAALWAFIGAHCADPAPTGYLHTKLTLCFLPGLDFTSDLSPITWPGRADIVPAPRGGDRYSQCDEGHLKLVCVCWHPTRIGVLPLQLKTRYLAFALFSAES